MAVTRSVPNELKFKLGKGEVDFSADVFKIILMKVGFVFDKDTHGTLADITANQIATGFGYTQDDKTLVAGTAWKQDDDVDMGTVSWADATWTAADGDIEDFIGAAIIDTTHIDNLIVGYIAFGETVTVTDGNSFTIQQLGFDLMDY